MSIKVSLTAQVKKDTAKALLKKLDTLIPETRSYQGCINITVFTQTDNRSILLWSEWQSVQAYQAYLQWRTETGVLDSLMVFLDASPNIVLYNKQHI